MDQQRQSMIEDLSKASRLARTQHVEGIGPVMFLDRIDARAPDPDFAEGHKDIFETYWNGFATDLQAGRYLSVKKLEEALEKRLSGNGEGHAEKVVGFRLSILENVLLHYEVYGYAPMWDELGPGQQDEQLGLNHERRVKLGNALKERRDEKGLFESYDDLKDWATDIIFVSESHVPNVLGDCWVTGVSGRRGGPQLQQTQRNLIRYAEETDEGEVNAKE